MIEHKIGEQFEIDHLIFEVRQKDNCIGCSLFYEEECVCLNYDYRFGVCSEQQRKDGKSVIFVKVGEDTDS